MLSYALVSLLAACACAKTVVFPITLTYEKRNPDGGPWREMILMNGQSPGPALILDQGDDVVFTVTNNLPFNSAVHFHGINQLGTPWSDGVPGLSQKAIPSGKSFIYRWTAYESGTYFYHGHDRGQISNGLYGPIHINPSPTAQTPYHLISKNPSDIAAMQAAAANPNIVLISDWSHVGATQLQAAAVASGIDLYCANSILINGKGSVYCLGVDEYEKIAAPSTLGILNGTKITNQGCSPPVPAVDGPWPLDPSKLPKDAIYGCTPATGANETFLVDSAAKWASFNFIAATGVEAPLVSIDEHELWVYAVDGAFITPQRADGVQMLQGERYSAMVKLNKRPGAYTLRAPNFGFNQLISGFATMQYTTGIGNPRISKPYYDYSGANVSASVVQLNTNNLPPFPPHLPAANSDATHILPIVRDGHAWKWTENGKGSYPLDGPPKPLLWYPNSTFGMNANYTLRTQNNTWVDVVFTITPSQDTPLQPPHPIHKHSNKAYIIGAGIGAFPGSTVAEAAKAAPQFFNFEDPAYRDSFVTPPAFGTPSWLAIRYNSANPGAWLMHCHIQTHLAGGMAVAILDGVDAWPKIPYGYGPNGNDDGGNPPPPPPIYTATS